jgi:hypothetical protein
VAGDERPQRERRDEDHALDPSGRQRRRLPRPFSLARERPRAADADARVGRPMRA